MPRSLIEKEHQALVKQRIEIEKQLKRDISELKQAKIDLAQTAIALFYWLQLK